jgi:hypothetical protein
MGTRIKTQSGKHSAPVFSSIPLIVALGMPHGRIKMALLRGHNAWY